MISVHTELVVGGALTGGFIGFFWHPVAALVAALVAAGLVAVGDVVTTSSSMRAADAPSGAGQ